MAPPTGGLGEDAAGGGERAAGGNAVVQERVREVLERACAGQVAGPQLKQQLVKADAFKDSDLGPIVLFSSMCGSKAWTLGSIPTLSLLDVSPSPHLFSKEQSSLK